MKNYKIVVNKPFWWFITGRPWESVAMTWGNTIYCGLDRLTPDILVHEEVHIQQNKGKWYISLWFLIRSTFDVEFYKKLEFEAYKKQLEFLNENSRLDGTGSKREILRKILAGVQKIV